MWALDSEVTSPKNGDKVDFCENSKIISVNILSIHHALSKQSATPLPLDMSRAHLLSHLGSITDVTFRSHLTLWRRAWTCIPFLFTYEVTFIIGRQHESMKGRMTQKVGNYSVFFPRYYRDLGKTLFLCFSTLNCIRIETEPVGDRMIDK